MTTQLENIFNEIFYSKETAKKAEKELIRLVVNDKDFMLSLKYSRGNANTSQVNILYVSGIRLMEGVADQNIVRKPYKTILNNLESSEVPFDEYTATLEKYSVTKQSLINAFEKNSE